MRNQIQQQQPSLSDRRKKPKSCFSITYVASALLSRHQRKTQISLYIYTIINASKKCSDKHVHLCTYVDINEMLRQACPSALLCWHQRKAQTSLCICTMLVSKKDSDKPMHYLVKRHLLILIIKKNVHMNKYRIPLDFISLWRLEWVIFLCLDSRIAIQLKLESKTLLILSSSSSKKVLGPILSIVALC